MREDWIKCTLGEMFNFIGGGTPSKRNSAYWNGTIPWASIKDLKGDKLISTQDSITETGLKNSSANLVYENEIILATRINPGQPILSKITAAINQDLKIARPRIKSDIDYLFWLLNTLKPDILKLSSGTTVLGINLLNLKSIKFGLPPLIEQKAIVKKIEALFSSLDRGIEDLKKAQEQLVVYRQAVLKKAFEGELTKEWRAQQTDLPSADELLVQIKEEREKYYEEQMVAWKKAIKALEENEKESKKPAKPKEPKYFDELTDIELKDFQISSGFYTKMGNLCDVVRGGSPRPAGDERFYNGPIPFLKVADLTRKDGMYVDSYTYSIKEAGLRKTRMLEIGTLVISNSGATLGVPKITAIKATANDGIAAFLGLTKNRSIFLYHYWNSKTLALRAINQGAGQPNLNTDLLKAYPVPVFSDNEQKQIIIEIQSRLSVCDKVEESITESLQKAQALRQSILKKAFEGALLNDEEIAACKVHRDYEPAGVLLGKIKEEKKKQSV